MKKYLILSVCALAALVACNKQPANEPSGSQTTTKEGALVRISPVMTKATEVSFEAGDAIGVTITREAGEYAANEKLVFNGSEFAGSLMWYAEGGDGATIKAYYPYNATAPAKFSVQADQSEGTSASDFIAGIKENVLPSAHAVTVPFKHKLSRIILNVTNNAGGEPKAIRLKGAKLTADIAADFTATVDESAEASVVTAYKKNATTYYLIVPPQTVSFIASVITAGDNELAQSLAEVALAAGKQYTINIIVNPADLKVTISGDIENWEDGGELGGDNTLIEKLGAGYIMYHEAKYTVAKMKDGKWWMTQNLRYVPEGITVGDALSNVTAGVYYPLVVNAGQTALEFSKDITVIEAKGYLYQSEVALGLKVGDLTTVEAAQALEGAQGICPKGWHVPTIADITGLIGKAVSPIATNADAPYYDGTNGSIALLNADDFNMDAFGAISIGDNTKTAGTFMGWAKAYPNKVSSGMICGSSYAGVTYNTANDATSGVKNLQFYGLMPMTNKATEAEYTCNGTKVSYRIAGPLRCVRND